MLEVSCTFSFPFNNQLKAAEFGGEAAQTLKQSDFSES